MKDSFKKLWNDWREHYSKNGWDPGMICRDGIIQPQTYISENYRVLFILKESNDFPAGEEYPEGLVSLWNKRPKGLIGHNLGRWAAGIFSNFKDFDEIDNYEIIHQSLKRTAAINVKKYTGGPSAWSTSLHYFTKQDRELLLRQIALISPTHVIACRTIDQLIWLLDLKRSDMDWYAGPMKSEKLNAWIVPFEHPSARGRNRISYESLSVLFRDI